MGGWEERWEERDEGVARCSFDGVMLSSHTMSQELQDIPANAFSLPVKTIAPILSSSSSLRRASLSSSNNGELKALRAFGRLSVTRSCQKVD